MHHDVAKIKDHPSVARESLFFALLAMVRAHIVQYSAGEGVQHAVAGTGADHKIIGERNNILDVQEDNVLRFFVFQ